MKRRPALAAMLALMLLAGCTASRSDRDGPAGAGDGEDPAGPPSDRPGGFQAPVQVNAADGEGFEPSLRVAPDGTVYVAAARGFLVGDSGGTASPVWYSSDDGATWTPLATPLGVERGKGIEGDLAVDAVGNVYFVDTWGPDNVFTVWDADQRMRSSRAVQGTLIVDDRPWLAAQGDGVVYYLGNGVAPLPSPTAPGSFARYWFYVSADHGATWSLGQAFAESGYCHVAASPADDQSVAVVCIGPGVGPGTRTPFVDAHMSVDRGATWSTATLVRSPRNPAGDFPSVTFDADGAPSAAWMDADGSIASARRQGHDWEPLPSIASEGPAASPSIAGGPDGRLAIAAYVRGDGGWRMEAWTLNGTSWNHDVADAGPLGQGEEPPQDFFQAAYDGLGRLHIAYQDDDPLGSAVPVQPYLQPILHVREAQPRQLP